MAAVVVVACCPVASISTSASVVIPRPRPEVFALATDSTNASLLRSRGPFAGIRKVEMQEGQMLAAGAKRQVVMTDGTVLVSVNDVDQIVELDLNNNPGRPSVVRDIISAVQNSAAASALIEVDQISGPSLFPVGPSVGNGIDLVLEGANAAQAVTDLGTNGLVRTRFISTTPGAGGVGTRVTVTRSNLNLDEGQLPFVSTSDEVTALMKFSAVTNAGTAKTRAATANAATILTSAPRPRGVSSTRAGSRRPTSQTAPPIVSTAASAPMPTASGSTF